MKKKNGNNNEIFDGVHCLLSSDRKKNKQSKTYVSYRLVQIRLIIVTGKIIASSNSLITSIKSSFSNILLKSVVTINFITGKILKLFNKVSEKFDLVRNWVAICR